MKSIKNIIFDYGAVIFDIDHHLTIEAFRNLGLSDVDQLFGHLRQHTLFDNFETGRISPEIFRKELCKLIGKSFPDEAIDTAWNAMLIGVPPENLELLLRIKDRYRTFLLSNSNEIHYRGVSDHLRAVHGIDSMADYFEKDYFSHQINMRKPDREIFEFLLGTHGLKASETLFIDDSPQHIRTAQALGIQTYLMGKGEKLTSFFKHAEL